MRSSGKMDPEKKALWCAALRSGKYPQSYGALRNASGYCCMGVLSAISPFEEKQNSSGYSYWGDYGAAYESIPEVAVLSKNVKEWAGLDSCHPAINGVTLGRLNDVETLTFPEIADLIEEYL